MYFKVSSEKPKLVLEANNRNLKNRFSAVDPQYLTDKRGEKYLWANYMISEDRMSERTVPMIGYDHVVGRPVILKSCTYIDQEIVDKKLALKKREVLKTQIEILNDINSPLLPEPLDWFTVPNKVDGFVEDGMINSEPILVLDYISGITLNYASKYKKFDRFEKKQVDTADGQGKREEYVSTGLNITKTCMFVERIVDFLKVLHKNNYMVTSLAPEHILVIKNEIPRFVGLGRICKVKDDGTFDTSHINYGRMIKGYSAPELNKAETNFGEKANALSAAVYSLGVIMTQLICDDFKIHSEILKDGTIAYPNEIHREKVLNIAGGNKGYKLDVLLSQLCNSNPKFRLTNLDEISLTLKEIGGIIPDEEKKILDKIRKEKKQQVQNLNRTAKVLEFNRTESIGVVLLDGTDEKIEITKEILENKGPGYLIPKTTVHIRFEINENNERVIQRIWGERKKNPPKSSLPKPPDVKIPPVITVVRTMCKTARVLAYDSKKGIGTVELSENKEKIIITKELLESCDIKSLSESSIVRVTVECLNNGKKRAVKLEKMIILAPTPEQPPVTGSASTDGENDDDIIFDPPSRGKTVTEASVKELLEEASKKIGGAFKSMINQGIQKIK